MYWLQYENGTKKQKLNRQFLDLLRADDHARNMQKKSYVYYNFDMITSLTLVIYPCSVFLLDFFAQMIKNKLLQVPRISLIKNDKTSQEVDQKWTSSYVEPLCLCVCQVGLWFLSTRMSQHANSFVNFTLFCGELSFGTIQKH